MHANILIWKLKRINIPPKHKIESCGDSNPDLGFTGLLLM